MLLNGVIVSGEKKVLKGKFVKSGEKMFVLDVMIFYKLVLNV